MDDIPWLEWEWLRTPCELEITSNGPLPSGTLKGSLERDEYLRLRLDVDGSVQLPIASSHHGLLAGERLPTPDDVIGESHGSQVVLSGASVRDVVHSGLHREGGAAAVRASADVFRATQTFSDAPAHFVTEWLVNFDVGDLVLPQITERRWDRRFTRTRSGLPPVVAELDGPLAGGFARDHFSIELEGVPGLPSIRVGQVTVESAPKQFKPGFLEYKLGSVAPSEVDLSRVRDAVSFAIGRPLFTLGTSSFSEEGNVLRRDAFSIGSLASASSWAQPSMLPTREILEEHTLSEERTSRVVNAVAKALRQLNASHTLTLFRIGQTSLLDVAPAHIGAALEALRDAYAQEERKLKSTLLPKASWEPVCTALTDAFDRAVPELKGRADVDEESIGLLRKKIATLNEKSSNMKYSEFFGLLNLRVGEVEKKALLERNNPAHGRRYQEHEYTALSARVRALETLYGRCVLRLSGAAESYVDYSTLGFPARSLDEPLGGPKGDGVSA